ncbi:MAG: DsbA family protein [Candidatus Levybacteria bacterium]|nr:DsbA family protein [Candidatus Levybacteria bacterium]
MNKEGMILGGIGLITLLIVVGAALLLSGPKSSQSTSTIVTDKALLYGPLEDRNSAGSESAKVAIVEFGDFQCPACGVAAPIVKKIKEEYKDKIYVVFRNFPLTQHANAPLSAQAAYAAGKQGKFWEMYDQLYGEQAAWAEKPNAKDIISTFASGLGLNMTDYLASVNDSAGNPKIQKDQNDGYQLGVKSTPTFFINGEMYAEVLSYEEFKKIIDDKLK